MRAKFTDRSRQESHYVELFNNHVLWSTLEKGFEARLVELYEAVEDEEPTLLSIEENGLTIRQFSDGGEYWVHVNKSQGIASHQLSDFHIARVQYACAGE